MEDPLSIKLAPKSIDDVLGQKHLLGEGMILRNLINNKKIFSMILYGPPGIDKTSIAKAMVNDLGCRYRLLNAVINNKHDFDVLVEEAKVYNGIVLIMDEIHRLNKDKQDLLLPYIENGLITLVGMTTSNPYHAINPAIRSRCHLFELKRLSDDDIKKGLIKAINSPYLEGINITNEAIDYIVKVSSFDLRYAYNLLELAFYSTNDKNVTLDHLKTINSKPVFYIDKNEDGYYDNLSALQKSIRGSDVNASLHYLGKLLIMGDIESIVRRLSVICYEDIGLANPNMGVKVDTAINAALRVGLPEARIPLANIVIELALSPKSNSAYKALSEAINDIETNKCGDIPNHIKISANGYKYPHDYPNSWVKQQYLPDNIKHKVYYHPKETSSYERTLKQINDKLLYLQNKTD